MVSLTPTAIQWAVNREDWQEFRKSLKGKPTQEKLDLLRKWCEPQEWSGSGLGHRIVQVQNYLNALARGGFIKPTNKHYGVLLQIKDAEVLK